MKVVCINNTQLPIEWSLSPINLSINKCYEVISFIYNIGRIPEQYFIKNDKGDNCYYKSDRFISEKEFRKLKIKRLNDVSKNF
jgi:hypothetical protein